MQTTRRDPGPSFLDFAPTLRAPVYAACAFNPIYGQGMSTACEAARRLATRRADTLCGGRIVTLASLLARVLTTIRLDRL